MKLYAKAISKKKSLIEPMKTAAGTKTDPIIDSILSELFVFVLLNFLLDTFLC